MKDQEIQIGCTYRVIAGAITKIITIKDREGLLTAMDVNDRGGLEPIVLDADELVRLGFIVNDTRHQWNKRDCKPEGVHENNVASFKIWIYFQESI